ncbi:hypothetical protein K439DRAFT_1337623, partial [Ramaria rubella]
IADILGIHRNTLQYKLKEAGLHVKFSTLADDDLVLLLKAFKQQQTESGLWYFIGWLQTNGIHVQKERIRLVWAPMNAVEQSLQHDAMHDRWVYTISRPNRVWHLDGHHKLIMYGIVVHGIIDGFCHTVCSLFPLLCSLWFFTI